MDEPDGGCSWQAWKFGLKREDLYTKLQDQYNTVTLSIQDPDAFHHDVCEISKTATDLAEFHRLLEERKQLRLEQLNESLQSASVEIIANPELIGTDQWQHAIQLFRTKSYDSLVRYFSSYLPEDHDWNPTSDSSSKPFFDDISDSKPILTYEPVSFDEGESMHLIPISHLPPSPRSPTMCSDASTASTPSRSLSFSEESDGMALSATYSGDYDDDTSQWDDDTDAPTTPISDISDMNPSVYPPDQDKHGYDHDHHERPMSPSPLSCIKEDEGETPYEASTPTPREVQRNPIDSQQTTPIKSTSRSIPSPKVYTLLEQRIRETSPGSIRARRKSPEVGRIQKASTEAVRARPRSLKR
ncbi:hypothetical protein GGS20DRAFT_145568 [Poronia punctata]|nr:hypothetical protein GGS20DRAFT_145568 [Poronia punctata]